MYEVPLLDLGMLDLGAMAFFLLLLFFTEYWPTWWFHYKSHHDQEVSGIKKPLGVRDLPGPRSFPIIGTRWIYYGKFSLNKIHEAYRDMFKIYGPILKEEAIWNYPIVSLKEKSDIEKVLRFSSKFPLRPPTEVTAHYRKSRPDRYTNLGLINEQGETWHFLRSHLTPELISGKTMQRFTPELNNVAEDFNRLISLSRDEHGTVRGFDELACSLGLESTCTLILGRRLGFLEKDVSSSSAQKLANAVRDQFCASRDTFFGLPFWKIFPTPAYKKFMESEDTIYDVISELVDDTIRDEKDTCQIDAVESVFMSILQAPGLDIRDKKAGIIDFIAAGIKTLGNTLVFLLYLIAKHPECQEKLYDEIIKAAPSGPITPQILREIPYLRACMMESFRVLPTAPCLARIIETDMELSGYRLKPGAVVLCHTWLACLEETNFKEALRFNPERWLSDESHSSPFLVIPFGAGRRMCPGKRFVELELQVTLAQLVREFKVEFEGELGLEFQFLLAPQSPSNFKFKERT